MKFLSILFFLILIAGFSSCTGKMGKNEKQLLFSDFHSRSLPLDSLKNLGEMLSYFDKIYCEDGESNWPFVYVDPENFEISQQDKGGNFVKVGIEPTPCPDLKLEYDFKCILEIVKDGHNIEVEEQRTELDSVGTFVRKHYLNYNKDTMFSLVPEANGIWICALKKETLKDLMPLVGRVLKAYISAANEYSNSHFGKNVEKLNSEELKELKLRFPFRLAFKFTDDVSPVINVG